MKYSKCWFFFSRVSAWNSKGISKRKWWIKLNQLDRNAVWLRIPHSCKIRALNTLKTLCIARVWGSDLARNTWANSWTGSPGSYPSVKSKSKGVGADVREGGEQQNCGSLDLDQVKMNHTWSPHKLWHGENLMLNQCRYDGLWGLATFSLWCLWLEEDFSCFVFLI